MRMREIKIFMAFIAGFALVYLLFVITYADFNITHWEFNHRGLFSYFGLVCGIASSVIYAALNEKK